MASPVWWQEMCFFCSATRTSSITKSHLVPYIFIGRSLPKQVFYCRITDYCVVMSNFFLHMNLLTLELLLNAYRACCLGLVFIHKHKCVSWTILRLPDLLLSFQDSSFYKNVQITIIISIEINLTSLCVLLSCYFSCEKLVWLIHFWRCLNLLNSHLSK